jgi:hypothetical protein
MVTESFKVPFIDTLEPSILIRGVFIRISLVWDIPIRAITLWERILIALPLSTNT